MNTREKPRGVALLPWRFLMMTGATIIDSTNGSGGKGTFHRPKGMEGGTGTGVNENCS